MAVVQLDTKSLASLVQPSKLAKKDFSVPNRVCVTSGTDHTGEDAYYVYLVFPDNTPDESLSWDKIKQMVRWVRGQIWKANGEERWPYVRVKRESEF
ncbi:MAG TPA: hypothetical protein VFC44_21730 [Candidatus Saccharimonadales bacterium]|nr:hypothetical protein [Candidatus Saccharimonadales bacterium]